MAPLSKLTLTSYRRTQPNRDPIEERRNKTLTALEQQKLVLAAALNGQEHTVTNPGWERDADGNRHRVEKTHAVRPWFFRDTQGWVVQLKYGARVVPLDADNNAVIFQSLDDVAAVLDIFVKAVAAGELDKPLAALAQRKKDLSEGGNMLATHDPTRQLTNECCVFFPREVRSPYNVTTFIN